MEEPEQGPDKKKNHHMMAMEWLTKYPEEHQQWLTLMQERHLILAEQMGKRKSLVASWSAAEARKDQEALEAAKKIRDEGMLKHFKALRAKREQIRQQCKALKEQHDKLSEAQIRAGIVKLLASTKEMNELMKEKGKMLDQMNEILKP
jgi:hypothetical protein